MKNDKSLKLLEFEFLKTKKKSNTYRGTCSVDAPSGNDS